VTERKVLLAWDRKGNGGVMAETVKGVQYFSIDVSDKPGEEGA